MEVDHMLACGIAWRRTGDPTAGWELIEGLESEDPCIQEIAKALLVDGGEPSMQLLESAVAAGIVTPQAAALCIAAILAAHGEHHLFFSGRCVH